MTLFFRMLVRVLQLIMAVILFAMMVVTVADVTGRYLFARPIPGGFEVVQYMMAFVIFASLPLTTVSDSHLSVSIVSKALSGASRRVHSVFVLLVSAIAVFVLAWRITEQAGIQVRLQQVSGFLRIPLSWIGYGIAVFAWLTFAIIVVMLGGAILGRRIVMAEAAATAEGQIGAID